MTRPILCLASLALGGCMQLIMPDASLDPESAGPDYALQGEYHAAGVPVGVQVVARGDGAFLGVLWSGGLPGAGYDGRWREELEGERAGSEVEFGGEGKVTLAGGRIVGVSASGVAFDLPRVERVSPTLGAQPPAGAVVVFDGTGTEAVDGETDERGLLRAGATSHARFHDARLHVEFLTPFEPTGRSQLRGNSGVYLQGRYEVQVLDSFGLSGEDNECGGIYQVGRPAVNMALPPLRWQTYDIDFTAARFDAEGAKLAPARVTVRHNGVLIHDEVEIPGPTGGGDDEGPEPGPLHLQDHWNPVFYRNVWLVPGSAPGPAG